MASPIVREHAPPTRIDALSTTAHCARRGWLPCRDATGGGAGAPRGAACRLCVEHHARGRRRAVTAAHRPDEGPERRLARCRALTGQGRGPVTAGADTAAAASPGDSAACDGACACATSCHAHRRLELASRKECGHLQRRFGVECRWRRRSGAGEGTAGARAWARSRRQLLARQAVAVAATMMWYMSCYSLQSSVCHANPLIP